MSTYQPMDGAPDAYVTQSGPATQVQSQARPQPPKLIVTPCTPVLPEYEASFSDQPIYPSRSRSHRSSSSSSSRSNDVLAPISEKSSSSSTSTRPKTHRSNSLPLEVHYLCPPSTLPPPKSGTRPLRSPLISIIFLMLATLLIMSATMCTSDRSIAFIESKQRTLSRLGIDLGMTSGRGSEQPKTSEGAGGDRMEYASTPLPTSSSPENEEQDRHDQAESETEEGEGAILSTQEWEHYTSIVSGPAMSISGEAWDVDY